VDAMEFEINGIKCTSSGKTLNIERCDFEGIKISVVLDQFRGFTTGYVRL